MHVPIHSAIPPLPPAPVLGVSAVTAVATIGVLVLLGLFLIYYLLQKRLVGFGSDLRRLQRDIHELKEDMRKVYAARAVVTRKEPAPAPPPPPTPVPVDLSGIESTLREMQGAITELSERSPVVVEQNGVAPPPPPTLPAITLRERIEARFRHAGYDVLHILSGDVDRERIDGDPVRVPLEGRRRGATYKGHVMISGDQVIDEKMTSSHEAFP